jgi:hypothetical protein
MTGAIRRISQVTLLQRQAPASDASGQAVAHPLKFGNALVDTFGPTAGDSCPISAFRDAICRQSRQLCPDLIEAEAHLLREHYESNAPKYCTRVPTVAGSAPLRLDQPLFFVEPECGSSHAATARNFTNSKQLVHRRRLA